MGPGRARPPGALYGGGTGPQSASRRSGRCDRVESAADSMAGRKLFPLVLLLLVQTEPDSRRAHALPSVLFDHPPQG
eukprot:752907-Hanusia_phi.AAC.2